MVPRDTETAFDRMVLGVPSSGCSSCSCGSMVHAVMTSDGRRQQQPPGLSQAVLQLCLSLLS